MTSRKRIVVLFISSIMAFISSVVPALAWDLDVEEDDFGEPFVMATTYFIQGYGPTTSPDRINNADAEDVWALALRCQDSQLTVLISTLRDDVNFNEDTSIKVKFSKNGSPISWKISSATQSSGFFIENEKAFAQRLTKSSKFYIRISGNGIFAANFNVASLTKYKSRFKSAGCSW